MMVNTVRDHLGIGFRSEGVAQAFQIGAQRLVIFDDPVVHDRHAVSRYVRMGIVSGRDARGCPAEVQYGRRRALVHI